MTTENEILLDFIHKTLAEIKEKSTDMYLTSVIMHTATLSILAESGISDIENIIGKIKAVHSSMDHHFQKDRIKENVDKIADLLRDPSALYPVTTIEHAIAKKTKG